MERVSAGKPRERKRSRVGFPGAFQLPRVRGRFFRVRASYSLLVNSVREPVKVAPLLINCVIFYNSPAFPSVVTHPLRASRSSPPRSLAAAPTRNKVQYFLRAPRLPFYLSVVFCALRRRKRSATRQRSVIS